MSEKYAIIALTDPADHPRIYHAFLYLFDLLENGMNVELYLDGASVKIVDELEKNHGDIIYPLYERAVRKGLIRQACGFCANAFNVDVDVIQPQIKTTTKDNHISISKLIKDGYHIITV